MRLGVVIVVGLIVAPALCLGDDVLYRYEGDVLPYDPSAGWMDGLCENPCSESLENGHFVLRWPYAGDRASYTYIIANEPTPPHVVVGRVAISLQPPDSATLVHL